MSLNPKIYKKDKVVIFGHKGLIGSAIFKELKHRNYKNLVTIDKKKTKFT